MTMKKKALIGLLFAFLLLVAVAGLIVRAR
jgi:hypothetical protein